MHRLLKPVVHLTANMITQGLINCQILRSPLHKVRTNLFFLQSPCLNCSRNYMGLDDISNDLPDPADAADADAYELIHNDSTTINSNRTTVGGASDLTEQDESDDQTEVADEALTPPQGMSTVVVDQFPFGSPGMPIPDKPRGSSVYESWRAASVDSPWAPFQSEVEWNVARWVKMRGQTSTAVTELLAIPGVRVYHQLYTICLTQV